MLEYNFSVLIERRNSNSPSFSCVLAATQLFNLKLSVIIFYWRWDRLIKCLKVMTAKAELYILPQKP